MPSIAVGILSHNRLSCLQTLVKSIRTSADGGFLDIFVGEDSDPDNRSGCRDWLRKQTDLKAIFNDPAPFGVAGNLNVLLEAMKDYEWKFLFNDDMAIIKHGWTNLYINSMEKAGLHHCCLETMTLVRKDVAKVNLNGVDCLKISEKPQGHCMVFDQKAFETVGYFDEKLFPKYGFEHVDWSNRVSLSGIQPPGFWDIWGARNYILSCDRIKATIGRREQYKKNQINWEKVRGHKSRIYIEKER
jgi:GT2 family glycosyltransferase